VPAVLSVVWFAASGAEGLAYLILILGAPALVGLTAIGWTARTRVGAATASDQCQLRQARRGAALRSRESGGPGCDPQLKRRLRAAL